MKLSWLCVIFITLVAMNPAWAQDRELSECAIKLAQQISQSGKRTIAVAGIANVQQYGPQFSDYVADQLSTFLAGSGKGFDVVTRSRLTQIMDERRLKFGASFDAATFQQLGKLAGADAIIGGSYRVLGSVVSTNLQILDVSRGTIIAGSICSIPRTKDVEELLGVPSMARQPETSSDSSKKDSPKDGRGQTVVSLPPTDSFHPGETFQHGSMGLTFGSHKCKKNSDSLVCYLLVTRVYDPAQSFEPENPEYKNLWNCKLIDNFGVEHQLTNAYFVTGRGLPQKTAILGKGDSMWLAVEFSQAALDITSARIVFTWGGNQLHARVE